MSVCTVALRWFQAGVNTLPRAAAAVWRHGRFAGFSRGATARVLYQMPAAAICWLTYETFKHALLTVRTPPDCTTYLPTYYPNELDTYSRNACRSTSLRKNLRKYNNES